MPLRSSSLDYLALGDRDRFDGAPKVSVIVPKTAWLPGSMFKRSRIRSTSERRQVVDGYLYSDEAQLAWLNGYCRPIRLKDLCVMGSARPIIQEFPDVDETATITTGHAEPLFRRLKSRKSKRHHHKGMG